MHWQVLAIFLLCHVLLVSKVHAASAGAQLAIIGLIRIGPDDSRSLVVLKLRASGKTTVIRCDAKVPGTPYQLAGVNRGRVLVRDATGHVEHLGLEDAESSERAEILPWPNLGGVAPEAPELQDQKIVPNFGEIPREEPRPQTH